MIKPPRPWPLLALLLAASVPPALGAGLSGLAELRPLDPERNGPDSAGAAGQKAYVAAPTRLDGSVIQLPGRRIDSPTTARSGPVTGTDNLDCLLTQPTVLRDQLGCPTWSDGSITGRNYWLGTTTATRIAYAVTDPVAGNGTTKCRLMATTAVPPDQFFFGFRYELRKTIGAIPGPGMRLVLRPEAGVPVYMEHDLYVTSLATMWTSEPINVTQELIVSRLLWGGTCVGDAQNPCESFGLPTGPIPYISRFGCGPWFDHFCWARWIGSAPIGEMVGDEVAMPTGRWVRLRHETNADGRYVHWLDFKDGTGFHKIYDEPFIATVRCDSLGGNGSWEAANSPAYYDDFSWLGVEHTPPIPPLPFECSPTGYSDDIQWLESGSLANQSPFWFAALSSIANVDVLSAGDKEIRQTNIFPDNRFREEFSRALPIATALSGGPLALCEDTRLSSGLQVRAFTPTHNAGQEYVSRVFFNFQDGVSSVPMIDVQFSAAYDPVDDVGTQTPFQPGPWGNGGVRRVTANPASIGDSANYDSFDTGADPALGTTAAAVRTLCFEVDSEAGLTVSYGGVDLVGGTSGIAFSTLNGAVGVDELRHESENNANAPGRTLHVDNIVFVCSGPVCDCPVPEALRYLDNLEHYLIGVAIGAQDDDSDPQTPFRWSSVDNMLIEGLGAKSKALRMENFFRDTAQSPGGFELAFQAGTRLPAAVASPDRGWGVRTHAKLTDGATTRAWAPAAGTFDTGTYALCTVLLWSADTATLWTLQPDPGDPADSPPVWMDSGRTLASLGLAFDQWFTIGVQRNLNGSFLYFINGQFLRDSGGAIVRGMPLQSSEFGVHEDLGGLLFFGGDDAGAAPGSILYADNITAWGTPCLGDTNHDGLTDFSDLNNVLGQFNNPAWGADRPNIFPDVDGDGVADDTVVDFGDLNLVTGQFGQNCD